jgi:allophanate hydrolase
VSLDEDRVRDAVARADAADPAIWISRASLDDALARLHAAPPGALHGRLLAVKDNIDVAGSPTTAAFPVETPPATTTAPCVARLEAAGAVVMGKTNMDQFATGLVGTRSPYGLVRSAIDPRFVAGGSSSGSAVAVALGHVDIALGTDTAGSGRVPAAMNGIVGLKPTRGLVSTKGVLPACRSLDAVSVFARTTAEARLAFGVMVDPQGRGGTRDARADLAAAATPRIGVPHPDALDFFGNDEGRELFEAAVDRFAGFGADIVEVDVAPFLEAGTLLYGGGWVAERLVAVGDRLRAHPEAADPTVAQVILAAEMLTAGDVWRAMHRLSDLCDEVAPAWQRMDVLLLPTAPRAWTPGEVAADPLGTNTILGHYTNFVNLMDLCALALPAGVGASGAPFGVQLIGPSLADALLCDIGERYEAGGAPAATTRLAVVGAHLTGEPLNGQLTSRGARLVLTTRTAPDYRFFALPGGTLPKPGLIRVEPGRGAGIEVEVWEMDEAALGSFMGDVPSPLAIGTLILEDGSHVMGFLCEPLAVEGAREISAFGGWRAYRASVDADRPPTITSSAAAISP